MRRLLLVLTLLAASACGRTAPEPDPGPAPDPADVDPVVKANHALALKLHREIGREPGNVVFSPFGVGAACSMLSAGAAGDTLAEMEKALDLPAQKELHAGMGRLSRYLGRRKGVAVANALFGQQGVTWAAPFVEGMKRDYGAEIQGVDFTGRPETARAAINNWAEKQTRGKIKDLIGPGGIDPDAKLVLANAVAFESTWATPFEPRSTENADFHVSRDRKVTAALMHRESRFRYSEEGIARTLLLPYEAGTADMVVILPRERHGLAGLEKRLDGEALTKLLDPVTRDVNLEVAVWLPKFTFTRATDLKATLTTLGMKKAFTPEADLSALGAPINLYVGEAVHKAFIDVDEKGTKARAGTMATMKDKGEAPRPAVFRADEPFLFVIRDTRTGLILFMGRVGDPTAK